MRGRSTNLSLWLALVCGVALLALLLSWQLHIHPVWYASSSLLSGGLTIILARWGSARRLQGDSCRIVND